MNVSDINHFIERFEAGTLHEKEWHHREHLLMTFWYLINNDEFNAVVKIKGGILKYNLLYKTPQGNGRGYHETITIFFIKVVQHFISTLKQPMKWHEQAQLLTEKYPNHLETLKEHYSLEVLRNPLSRIQWFDPDLKSLGGFSS